MPVATVRLTDVDIAGPFTGKKGQFFVHNLITGKDKYGIIRNDADQVESVGDTVVIAYETTTKSVNGKTYTNNYAKKVEILEDSSPPFEADTNKASETSNTGKTLTQGINKDISMEVSGILQALINHEGLSDDTEQKLRDALNLKRKVASELEQTGSV